MNINTFDCHDVRSNSKLAERLSRLVGQEWLSNIRLPFQTGTRLTIQIFMFKETICQFFQILIKTCVQIFS